MTDSENIENVEVVECQLPGALLRSTREAQGLTVGEVAGALKFSTRQIDALERDDFEQLQGKTFLRGFIRAYARMLKLDVESVLALLDAQTLPPQEQILAPGNMGDTDPKPIYRRHAKKFLMSVTLAATAAGVVWYVAEEPLRQVDVQPVAVTIPDDNVVPTSTQPLSTDMSLSGTGVVTTSSMTALIFDFSDLSWLEVKDGDGKKLLDGEFPAGQRQKVNGNPPYQVWIGKASAVKVTYRDQPFDFQPYVREEVARFSIDK